jgi:hypothetical protein
MNKQKIFLIALVVTIVGVGGYLFATNKIGVDSRENTSPLVSAASGQNPVAMNGSGTGTQGVEIANLLNGISKIQLNDAILNDPAFLSLTDSSIILPVVQTSGRVNPFSRGAGTIQPITTTKGVVR